MKDIVEIFGDVAAAIPVVTMLILVFAKILGSVV